jgi:hypothetical protein
VVCKQTPSYYRPGAPPPPPHTHTLTQHLQVELWGVNVTNMAAKSVDHFWAGLYVQLMHDIASTVDVRACMKYCKRGATRYVGLLGNLAYSRKARIRFILSVRPSVRPPVRMYQLDSHLTDFNEILYWEYVCKFVDKIEVLVKIGQLSGTLHEDLSTLYHCR